MAKKGESNDRLSIWPTAMACCLPLVLIILWSGPFDLAVFGTAVLLMSWACSALLALAMAIFSARSHHWWRAVSMSVLPFVTLVVIVNAGSFWSFAMETGERIHFLAMRRSYLQDVSRLQSSSEPRFLLWRWGGFVVGHAVVYDESDEIMLPEQSSAWKKRVQNTEVGMCGAWGSPLGKHFYLVRTDC
jgi:hypothetical protein